MNRDREQYLVFCGVFSGETQRRVCLVVKENENEINHNPQTVVFLQLGGPFDFLSSKSIYSINICHIHFCFTLFPKWLKTIVGQFCSQSQSLFVIA